MLRIWAVVAIAAPAVAQNLAWERQFGSASGSDHGNGVAADTTGAYGVGYLNFNDALPVQTKTGSVDSFIKKYDLNGNEVWTRQFGTGKTVQAHGAAAGGGGVYVVGGAQGEFPGQPQEFDTDAFVRKYDTKGNELWTREFGTSGYERASAVAVNATGVYVVGDAGGTLPNAQVDIGFTNFFVRKYDVDGNVKNPRGTRSAPDIPITLTIGEKHSNTVTIAVAP